MAQHLQDAIVAQPAQFVGGLRRGQEIGQAGVPALAGLLPDIAAVLMTFRSRPEVAVLIGVQLRTCVC